MAAAADPLSALFGGLGTTPTNDITAFNQQVAAQDPFGIVGKSIDAWNPNMTTWSPATSGITSFTKNFLSGLLGATAQSDAADQTAKIRPLLADLQGPNGANIQAPEGVDQGPFNTLAANEAEKRQTSQMELSKALGQVGFTLNPDGTVSHIKMDDGSDLSDALTQVKLDSKANANGTQKINAQAAGKLSSILTGIETLNSLKGQVNGIPSWESLGGQLLPNTAISQYIRGLNLVGAPLTAAFNATKGGGGGAGVGLANKVIQGLTPSFDTSNQTLIDTINGGISQLGSEASDYLGTLGDNNFNSDNLTSLQSRYQNAVSGKSLNDNLFQTGQTPAAAGGGSPPPGFQFTGSVDSQGRRGIAPITLGAPLG